MKYFSFKEFTDTNKLLALKKEKNITIGIALPILNEEKTIAKTIETIRGCGGLIDDLVIIDSGSTDNSVSVCMELGVRVIQDKQAAKDLGIKLSSGKGFNLWASVYYLKTDVIAWVDTDIKNIGKRFILGIIGPMIVDDKIKFVKGYYYRPKGDARVTEILVRPYVSLLLPELNDFIQPLSGECGGRRKFLETLFFYSGYSVEVAVLLQARIALNNNEIAQSFLGKRFHELQSVASLGKMGASILRTLLVLSRQNGRLSYKTKTMSNRLNRFLSTNGKDFEPESIVIEDQLLKPIKNYKND